MAALALALGTSRQTIKNYSAREELFDTVANARARCEAYWEGWLDSPYRSGAKYALSYNYDGWAEKQKIAGRDGAPLLLDAAILNRRSNGTASPSTTIDSKQ